MNEALLDLLETKCYDYITIKEICEKAGVNRSTFYLHYETMEDLLLESIGYVERKRDSKFTTVNTIDQAYIRSCPVGDLKLIVPEYLVPYLEFVKENKKVFLAAASQPVTLKTGESFHKLYSEIFEPIMIRFQIPEQERKYRVAFSLNGMYAVIMTWIKGGCAEEIDYIADLLIQYVNP